MATIISELQPVIPEHQPLISQPDQQESSHRKAQLAQWTVNTLAADGRFLLDTNIASEQPQLLKAIGCDAGFRNYYRVQTPDQPLIAVDAPTATEDSRLFVDIARRWRQGGVFVPQVFAVDYDQGFMLQEDMGDTLLQNVLQSSTADHYYPLLLDTLLTIQQQPSNHLPRYDEAMLQLELSLYSQWFLNALLKVDTAAIAPALGELFTQLIAAITEQPQGTVHRDYHCRNLMLTPDGTIGVIDFQGARHGPLLYDVASLLKDCYIAWPQAQVDKWFTGFIQQHPVLAAYDARQLQRWFDLVGLQRHLKCLGIFSRLWLRDGKPGYLNDIPRTLHYVLSVCQRYFKEHANWLQERVVPRVNERIKVAAP